MKYQPHSFVVELDCVTDQVTNTTYPTCVGFARVIPLRGISAPPANSRTFGARL